MKKTPVLSFENGDVYEGKVKNGKPHKRGVMRYANGFVYRGKFKNAKPNGQGRLDFPTGIRYEGEFCDGVSQGFGTLYFTDGSRYVGCFKKGKRHGRGTMIFAKGKRQIGLWKNDILISDFKIFKLTVSILTLAIIALSTVVSVITVTSDYGNYWLLFPLVGSLLSAVPAVAAKLKFGTLKKQPHYRFLTFESTTLPVIAGILVFIIHNYAANQLKTDLLTSLASNPDLFYYYLAIVAIFAIQSLINLRKTNLPMAVFLSALFTLVSVAAIILWVWFMFAKFILRLPLSAMEYAAEHPSPPLEERASSGLPWNMVQGEHGMIFDSTTLHDNYGSGCSDD